jgi:hypothetical protein
MWRCVDLALTDVSEERIPSIFRAEKSASWEPASAGGCSHRYENLRSYIPSSVLGSEDDILTEGIRGLSQSKFF